MPTALLVVYLLGLAATAAVVLRNRVFVRGYVVNAGAILLWPLYWGFYLVSMVTGRAK